MEELSKCCFLECNNKFKYGNNANPLMDGRCCDNCHNRVIKCRFRMITIFIMNRYNCNEYRAYHILKEMYDKNKVTDDYDFGELIKEQDNNYINN